MLKTVISEGKLLIMKNFLFGKYVAAFSLVPATK